MIRGIIDLIVSDSTCATEIGSANSRVKVFPVVAEQDIAKPYVLLRRTGELASIVKGNFSEWDTITVDVTAYADTYKKCVDILNTIRTAMDGFHGTSEMIFYDNIWYINSRDLFDQADNSFIIVDTYNATVKRV